MALADAVRAHRTVSFSCVGPLVHHGLAHIQWTARTMFLLPAAASCALLACALLARRRRVAGGPAEHGGFLHDTLSAAGIPCVGMPAFLLPAGASQVVVARGRDRLFVVHAVERAGRIGGGRNDARWTARAPDGSVVEFPNPAWESDALRTAVSSLARAPSEGVVVFTGV